MDLTQGNVSKQLVKFSLPIIIMQVLNQAYAIADSVIVSRFAGERELSIVSATMAVLAVGYCLVNGAGSACHILVGNQFGQRNYDKIKSTIKTVTYLGAVFSAIMAAVYIVGGPYFFRMVELPQKLMDDCVTLLRVYALSFIVQVICMIQSSVLNGIGDSRTPMFIGICTQILNIVLDIIVVAGMNGGAMGAAFASIFSLCVSVVWTYFVMRKKLLKLSGDKGEFDKKILWQYVKLTVPSLLQQSVMSVGSLFLQRLVNVQGINAINGYTVACNINSFFIIPIISYTMAYETFASQNLGAKDEARARQGFRSMLLQCGAVCIALSVGTILFAKMLIGLYLSDSSSYSFQFAYQYIMILIPNFFALLLKYGVDSIFKARMKIYLFTISSLISLVVRIGFSYAVVGSGGLLALAVATVVGNLAAIVFNWGVKIYLKY